MNKKAIISLVTALIALILIGSYLYYYRNDDVVSITDPNTTSITYKNTQFGFDFTLPSTWQGYTVVNNSWTGTALKSTTKQSGTKLLIRNPKWTATLPYEDLPVLVFTIAQWNAYLNEEFSVSAAPIVASELGRNNKYVFALPPRWNYDYSEGYVEAENIIKSNPLKAFDIGATGAVTGKLNINVVCEQALIYMTFPDSKSADAFVAECKEGKHPEVIERYKKDMNLGDGATI